MTLESLQMHEAYVLPYLQRDYRRKNLERLVQRHVTGTRVIDIRCLTGHLAVDLALRGCDVTGLDGHERGVELANRHAREQGLQKDIARLWDLEHLLKAVGGARFETAICLDTLNHVENDEPIVAQLAQVLVEGGQLIVAAPAFPSLRRHRDRMLGHMRRYTRRGICRLLERHGFTIQTMRYWNFLGLLPYFLIERVANREIPERLRYGRQGSLPNRMLHWWYRMVENRLLFPVGLTLFIVAHKRSDASG